MADSIDASKDVATFDCDVSMLGELTIKVKEFRIGMSWCPSSFYNQDVNRQEKNICRNPDVNTNTVCATLQIRQENENESSNDKTSGYIKTVSKFHLNE